MLTIFDQQQLEKRITPSILSHLFLLGWISHSSCKLRAMALCSSTFNIEVSTNSLHCAGSGKFLERTRNKVLFEGSGGHSSETNVHNQFKAVTRLQKIINDSAVEHPVQLAKVLLFHFPSVQQSMPLAALKSFSESPIRDEFNVRDLAGNIQGSQQAQAKGLLSWRLFAFECSMPF